MGSKPRTSADLAGRMLTPTVLDESVRSGLFLASQLDSERWNVFAQELVSELQRLGALVIFIDLADFDTDALRALP